MQRYIAVVGGGTCSAEEAAAAERIGALIARADSVLVCGGLRPVPTACRYLPGCAPRNHRNQ